MMMKLKRISRFNQDHSRFLILKFFLKKIFLQKTTYLQFLQNWFFWSEEVLVVSVKILILDIGLDDSYLVWFFI